jgi:hypothetical protein
MTDADRPRPALAPYPFLDHRTVAEMFAAEDALTQSAAPAAPSHFTAPVGEQPKD